MKPSSQAVKKKPTKKTGTKTRTMRPLCFRCEHRADFHETQARPRYECGDVEQAVCGCYMYKPVRPVVLERDEGDPRAVADAPIIAARAHGVAIASGDYIMRKSGGLYSVYYVPKP